LNFIGITRPREDEVELRQRLNQGVEFCAHGGDLMGQLGENPVHLFFLGESQFAERIVQFDDRQRLHEERHTGGGTVVDDAGHLPLEARLDGNDKASLAPGDDRILKVARDFGRGHHPPQALLNTLLSYAQVVTNARQLRGGGVAHLAAVIEHAGDGGNQMRLRRNPPGDIGESGELRFQPSEDPVDLLRPQEGVPHLQKFLRHDNHLMARLLDPGANVVDAAEGEIGTRDEERARLRGQS